MYLKHHYPHEWWTSVLNLHINDEDKMRQDIMLLGEMVSPPSVENTSERFLISQNGDRIITPISAIKGIGPKALIEIVNKGPFTSLWDFIDRVSHLQVNIGAFQVLVKARATDIFMAKDLENGMTYEEARKKMLDDYLVLRRKKLKTFRSVLQPEIYKSDPVTVFLMERDFNMCFNKVLLKDAGIIKTLMGRWPGLCKRDKPNIPFTIGNVPILNGIETATKLLKKGFEQDIGLILLYKGSATKSGVSKKTNRPYSMLKVFLSDGYHDIECVLWDYNKALNWKKDSIVYARGILKEGWKTPVSMTLKELERVEKI
jgi:DNA polymerase III alpha subunit